ncbi:MAG: Crp/Fnr family transcriptional regulator [Spartobacteria bacterium]
MSASKLPAIGILANLDPEDVKALASYGTFETATPGTVVIEQGISHAKLFLVIDGELNACRNDQGHDVLLGQVCAGEWMGEVSLFDPSETLCFVVAATDCRYWVITRDNLEEFLTNHSPAGMLLLIGLSTTLSRRIREVTSKLAALHPRNMWALSRRIREVPFKLAE